MKENVLLNVCVLPQGHFDGVSLGVENRLYLNGIYIARYNRGVDYTMTSEAFLDIISGLKMAFPDIVYKEELFDRDRFAQIGKERNSTWRKRWIEIEKSLCVQVTEE